jgi:hypothetical protein
MAEIAMVRDLAVLASKKIRRENLELRFTLSRLDAPWAILKKLTPSTSPLIVSGSS